MLPSFQDHLLQYCILPLLALTLFAIVIIEPPLSDFPTWSHQSADLELSA